MTDDDDDDADDLNRVVSQPLPMQHRVVLLAERVMVLTRENRDLRRRIVKLEVTYQRGFGVFLVFPFLGAMFGFLATYWSSIFKPWTK